MPSPSLLIGCPVRQRAWIMPTWFVHVEAASAYAGVTPSYTFVTEPGDETLPILTAHGGWESVVLTLEPEPHEDQRQWHREARLQHMVYLRNLLLRAVREDAPEVFLSLDSDVLLAPEAIADLLESLGRFDAVGGGTYMSRRGTRIPNCGWVLGKEGLRREHLDRGLVIPVGVIMAVKAMSPAAYAVDYRFAREGEDIGWSLAAGEAGVRLGWDNRHPAKHVMHRDDLDRFDERCGF